MFAWLRRLARPARTETEPDSKRLGESHWIIVPPVWSDADDLCHGTVGEPWKGEIVRAFGPNLHVEREVPGCPLADLAVVHEDQLYPSAEAARDAYIEAMEAEIEDLRATCREPATPDHRGEVPRPSAQDASDRGEPGPAVPEVGGRYWLVAPIHDTLNLGFGMRPPWQGAVVEVVEGGYRVAPEGDFVMAGEDPYSCLIFRDACVDISGLHRTEDEAWDVYYAAEAEEKAEQVRHLSRWIGELERWKRAREDGLARPRPAN